MFRDLEAAKKECIHQDRLISIIQNCNFTVASLMLQAVKDNIHLRAPSAFTQPLSLTIKWKRQQQNPMDTGSWQGAVHSICKESDTNEVTTQHSCTQQSRNQRKKWGSSSPSSLCMSTLGQPHIHLTFYSLCRVDPPLHKGENLKYHHLVSGISHGPESLRECAILSTTKSERDSSWSDQPII